MDMGIAGRTALVCAASKGLGRGCAEALAAEGVNVTIVARTAETLEATAAEIRAQSGVDVKTVACDITTPEGRAAALAACPQPDILVNNAGGPPPGDFRNFTADDWIRALDSNMLTPIELIRATIDGMSARGYGRIVNITSSAVKAPIDVLGPVERRALRADRLRRGTRAQGRAHRRDHQQPAAGPVRHRPHRASRSRRRPRRKTFPSTRRAAQRTKTIPAGRFGTRDEFGAACAFLCSVHAGYITGQNLLIDGGAYPGTF